MGIHIPQRDTPRKGSSAMLRSIRRQSADDSSMAGSTIRTHSSLDVVKRGGPPKHEGGNHSGIHVAYPVWQASVLVRTCQAMLLWNVEHV
jgi:hypothetical protein